MSRCTKITHKVLQRLRNVQKVNENIRDETEICRLDRYRRNMYNVLQGFHLIKLSGVHLGCSKNMRSFDWFNR